MLVPVIGFSVWQDVGFIMTTPTQSDSVGHFYSKFRGIFPRLDMMHYGMILFGNIFFARLANLIVPYKALVTPLYILPVIKLSLGVKARLRSFGLALLIAIRFIRAVSRAIISSIFLIRINPESSSTPYAVPKKALFLHTDRSILVYE